MTRSLLASASIWVSMLVFGCQNKQDTTPAYLDIPPSQTDTMGTQPLINDAKLAGTSSPVRAAFLHDFPNAGISSIRTLTTATGEVLYQITFIQNGQPDIVVYSDSGTMIDQPRNVMPIPPGVNLTR